MKSIFNKIVFLSGCSLIITLVFVTGCQQQTDDSNNQVEDNIKMYTNVWDEILNKGNIDMIDTHFAPNYVNKTVSSTVNGQAEAKEFFGAFLTGFSDIKFDVDEVFIHHLCDVRVFEGLVGHHVAPVAGGVADG